MNNIIFAPQVNLIQPAFQYGAATGENIKIYFSVSTFNTIENIQDLKVDYELRDTNLQAGWGTNIIAQQQNVDISFEKNQFVFIINFSQVRNKLVVNQFYEVQLRLRYQGQTSDWSQKTLIRPIPFVQQIILEQFINIFNLTSAPEEISGYIQYNDGSYIEQIKEIQIRITHNNNEVYRKPYQENFLGTYFKIDTSDMILSEGNYVVYIDYITINGYHYIDTVGIAFSIYKDNTEVAPNKLALSSLDIKPDFNDGSMSFKATFIGDVVNEAGVLKVLRADSIHEYLNWKVLTSASMSSLNFSAIYWKDYFMDNGNVYKYRFSYTTDNAVYIVDTYPCKTTDQTIEYKDIEAVANFEDIFLSDANFQLAIRYNPTISNLKWVTQESLSNSLGGKFPIVRINGETHYRQFNISGTLSFFAEDSVRETGFDSCNRDMRAWLDETNHSLFFDTDTAFDYIESEQFKSYKKNPDVIEKRFRDLAMQFLTNKKPKLFRSLTEGNMVIYLNNISFTPNKQLGRNIYDFSATATEFCEATYNNLKKYHLKSLDIFENYIYVLQTSGFTMEEKDGTVYLVPYLSGEDIFNGYPLIKAVKIN